MTIDTLKLNALVDYIHTYIHAYIHTYIHTHIHTYTHTQTHTHTHTHTHTQTETAQSKDIASDNHDVYCVSAPLSKLVETNIFVFNTQFYSRYFIMYNS